MVHIEGNGVRRWGIWDPQHNTGAWIESIDGVPLNFDNRALAEATLKRGLWHGPVEVKEFI